MNQKSYAPKVPTPKQPGYNVEPPIFVEQNCDCETEVPNYKPQKPVCEEEPDIDVRVYEHEINQEINIYEQDLSEEQIKIYNQQKEVYKQQILLYRQQKEVYEQHLKAYECERRAIERTSRISWAVLGLSSLLFILGFLFLLIRPVNPQVPPTDPTPTPTPTPTPISCKPCPTPTPTPTPGVLW